jgi:diaminopimelate epimerase
VVESPTEVQMDGGTVTVYFTQGYEKIFLEGPVDIIIKGEWIWKES